MLTRRPVDGFDRGLDIALRTARVHLDFILGNEEALLRVRNGERFLAAAREMSALLDRTGILTPNQLSYIESIYERTWEGAGYESARPNRDKRRPGLRFGK